MSLLKKKKTLEQSITKFALAILVGNFANLGQSVLYYTTYRTHKRYLAKPADRSMKADELLFFFFFWRSSSTF